MRTEHRLVIDTNVWVSRLLMPGSGAAGAVDAALAWDIPLVSEDTMEGLSNVLSREKFDKYVSREDRQQFLRLLGGIARMVKITQRVNACRDPKDDKFLDVALNGDAEFITSGDKDLLVLNPFHTIQVLSPADFLEKHTYPVNS